MTSRNDQRGITSHGLLRSLLTVAGGLVLALFVMELALRLFWPQIFPHHAPGMYTPHPEPGHVLTPSFEGQIQRSEFKFGFQTNEAGLRGPSLRPLTESSVRVLCLGDSLGWGMGVEYSQTYTSILESILLYWLKHHSHLVHLASGRAGSVAIRVGVLTDWERASSAYFTAEDGQLTGNLLTDLGMVAKRLGASTVLLYTLEKMQVLAGVEESSADAHVVARAANRSGAAYLDLTHAIGTDSDPSRFFFEEEGHGTAAGHELVASHLADEIVSLGLLEEDTSSEGNSPVLPD